MDLLTEQLNLEVSPLSVRCGACGAEASFDLARQNYHCLFCGGVTDIRQPLLRAEAWQERRHAQLCRELRTEGAVLRRCGVCGAALIGREAEEEARCPLCASPLRQEPLPRDPEVPALAIPFGLAPEEARAAVKAWAGRNLLQKEARRVSRALDGLQACYLPCQLVQGPVEFRVSRAACRRSYTCRSYARGVLADASAQTDSLLLHAVEPFDWDAVRPFTPALLEQGRAKLPDLPEKLLRQRIDGEAAVHHLGAVEQGLRSSDLQLQPELDKALSLPVLVPVYLLTAEGTRLIVNGQTGRIAVTRDKPVRSREWLLEPLILSLLATLFWIYAAAGNLELFILATAASVTLIFALLSGKRGERLHKRLFRIRDPLTERWEGRVFIAEGASRPEVPAAGQPLFVEAPDGRSVPVGIRYWNGKRIALFLLLAFLLIALPWLLACGIVQIRRLTGAEVQIGEIEAAYGALWYVLALALLLLGSLSLGRSLLFDHPILREILPDGGTRPIPKEKSAPGRLSLWARMRRFLSGDAIVGIVFGALVVLAGSVAAMLP